MWPSSLSSFHVLPILIALASASCGGGGEPPIPCNSKDSVRVQLFGDSTQVGFDSASTNSLAPHNPTAELQNYFDAQYGRGKVTVTSRAMNGSSARQLVDGTDGLNGPWPGSVTADVVVMNHGINDLYPVDDLAEYRRNLEVLSAAPGTQVVFETPNILRKLDITPYAEAMREVARDRGLPIADVFAYTSALPDWPVLLYDNAHPSDALYQSISRDVVQPVVAPIVARMLCR